MPPLLALAGYRWKTPPGAHTLETRDATRARETKIPRAKTLGVVLWCAQSAAARGA
jgi:hypothetical protein